MVEKNESIKTEKWNSLATGVTKLANEKQVKIYHTEYGSTEKKKEILPTDKWMEKNARIKTDQVVDILGAINQLETSFANNCCQRQCHCQKNCYTACQSYGGRVQRVNTVYDERECRHINCIYDHYSCERQGCQNQKNHECIKRWQRECAHPCQNQKNHECIKRWQRECAHPCQNQKRRECNIRYYDCYHAGQCKDCRYEDCNYSDCVCQGECKTEWQKECKVPKNPRQCCVLTGIDSQGQCHVVNCGTTSYSAKFAPHLPPYIRVD